MRSYLVSYILIALQISRVVNLIHWFIKNEQSVWINDECIKREFSWITGGGGVTVVGVIVNVVLKNKIEKYDALII